MIALHVRIICGDRVFVGILETAENKTAKVLSPSALRSLFQIRELRLRFNNLIISM